jgi:hypothetical protein
MEVILSESQDHNYELGGNITATQKNSHFNKFSKVSLLISKYTNCLSAFWNISFSKHNLFLLWKINIIFCWLFLNFCKQYKDIESGTAYDNLKPPTVICIVRT